MWDEATDVTRSGRLAIRRFFDGLKESWDGEDVAIMRDPFKAGGKVVSRMDWRVGGRTSGIETHLDITNVNTAVGGKIVRPRHYFDHAEALKAAGLAHWAGEIRQSSRLGRASRPRPRGG